MKYITVFLFVAGLAVVGCGEDRSKNNQVSQSQPREADNTGVNVRDRGGETKTPGDQSESEADRKITQEIRQAITSDDKLSTNAQNVKIIAKDGNVTLRGPVKSEQEKVEIEKKAKQVAGVKKVENQLEVAS
jgi:hyperosmotically inducible periplasmic protein